MAIWAWDEISADWTSIADTWDEYEALDIDGWRQTDTTPTTRQYRDVVNHLALVVEADSPEQAHDIAMAVTGYADMH